LQRGWVLVPIEKENSFYFRIQRKSLMISGQLKNNDILQSDKREFYFTLFYKEVFRCFGIFFDSCYTGSEIR